jgi:hypothetical protein
VNKASDFEHIETTRKFDLANDCASSGVIRLELYSRGSGVDSIKLQDQHGSFIFITPKTLAHINGAIKLYEKTS